MRIQVDRVKSHASTVKDELYGAVVFVAIIWAVFLVDYLVLRSVSSLDLRSLGLVPRSLWGLLGIVTMPFLHQNFQHIVGNTLSLFVLLALLAGSRARTWQVVVIVTALSGAMLWLIGPANLHVGASGLVFGLISFQISSGLFEKRLIPLAISIVVGLLYLPTLLSGILPYTTDEGVSWQGHLCGAIAGIAAAYLLATGNGPEPTTDQSAHGGKSVTNVR